jgi:hypothetical protein
MPSLDKLIRESESYAFSGEDMKNMTNNLYKIYRYHELENVDSVDEILGENLGCIILYQSTMNSGHWCCLFRDGNTCYFFDSYGYNIDEELQYSEFHMRRHKNILVPHLSHLLEQSGYKVISSPYKLQTDKNQDQTCGRFTGSRLANRNLSHEEFAHLFTKNKCYSPSWWVTAITGHINSWNEM